MKVLLIGYSSISKRRVIPALLSLGAESVDVASLSKSAWEWSSYLPLRMFRDYDQALDQTDAQAVYVSTVNSQHARWARKALQSGFHVIVDKPAFLSVAETQELIELAHRNQRCLAEATVYGCHPSISTARKAFEQAGSSPTHLLAVFSYPPVSFDNYRNFAESDLKPLSTGATHLSQRLVKHLNKRAVLQRIFSQSSVTLRSHSTTIVISQSPI